jgi:hypothetical protein
MKDKLKEYIDSYLKVNTSFFGSMFEKRACKATPKYEEDMAFECCASAMSVDNFINNNKDDNNFQKLLFKYIDDRNLKDSDVYNKVHIDRRLFSKIRSDETYHPSRETVLLLGLSLELSEEEIDKLLESASYTLAKNNHYDLILRFCFINKIYKVKDVNDLLNDYNCKLFNY